MSKFLKAQAVISIFLLAFCSGLLVSCDTEEDNSASYEEARKREKEVAEWTKIAESVLQTLQNGTLYKEA